jgi:hypothetical protein
MDEENRPLRNKQNGLITSFQTLTVQVSSEQTTLSSERSKSGKFKSEGDFRLGSLQEINS